MGLRVEGLNSFNSRLAGYQGIPEINTITTNGGKYANTGDYNCFIIVHACFGF
jgi:hypothetical protein